MKPPVSGDDTGDGLLIFVVFIVAALTSTVAVVLIALADEWWVVGFGFAIHVIVTAIVVLTIVETMGGSHRSMAHRNALTGASVSPRSSRAGSERAGAASTIVTTGRLPAAALEPQTTSPLRKSTGGRISRRSRVRDAIKRHQAKGRALVPGRTASLRDAGGPPFKRHQWKATRVVGRRDVCLS